MQADGSAALHSNTGNDLDSLLDSALQEMKISEPPQADNVPSERDAEFESMVKEFKQANTPSESADLPDRIDAALNKLLKMTDDETMSGMANEADFAQVDSMIEQMMTELTSKELLAEPFAEMARAYSAYLTQHRSEFNAEQFSTYSRQSEIVMKIDSLFKDPEFDGEKEANQKRIFELMQEMQELGPPPEDMLKEIGMSTEAQTQTPPECIQM